MATYNESLTVAQGNAVLGVCEGLRISHSWRSVDPCIFIEIGRLKRETLQLSNHSKPLRTLSGQITCMTEADWRVEKPRSIHFGSRFSDRRIDKLLKSLIGTRIIAVGLLGRLPELRIELDDGRVISTFTNWSNQPRWLIGFNDLKLFRLRALPSDTDISPWMHVLGGHPAIEYCYDDAKPAERQFFQQFRHA
jgi:hypothetical protein